MWNFIPLLAGSLLLQPAAGDPAKDGVVRVQLEGTLGSAWRANGNDEQVSASVRAGGGEFSLDLRGCTDARQRLAAYLEKARRSAFPITPRFRVAGRLEFRSARVVTVGDLDKNAAGVAGPPVPVLVVESLSLIDPGDR
jgi:hypothetical protein